MQMWGHWAFIWPVCGPTIFVVAAKGWNVGVKLNPLFNSRSLKNTVWAPLLPIKKSASEWLRCFVCLFFLPPKAPLCHRPSPAELPSSEQMSVGPRQSPRNKCEWTEGEVKNNWMSWQTPGQSMLLISWTHFKILFLIICFIATFPAVVSAIDTESHRRNVHAQLH